MTADEGVYGGSPPLVSAAEQVTLVEGTTFCISDRRGDIAGGPGHGLIHKDTRFLSRFELRVDGQPLQALTVERPDPYAAVFVARRPPLAGLADSTVLVVRRRVVSDGLTEEITVRNLDREPARTVLSLLVDNDFAGIFEVKEGAVPRHGETTEELEASSGRLSYRSTRSDRGVEVSAEGEPEIAPHRLTWSLALPPHGEQVLSVRVVPVVHGVPVLASYGPEAADRADQLAEALAEWRRLNPVVRTPDQRIEGLFRASAQDLAGLRIRDLDHPRRMVMAAGAPWFMTIFGRDSLLTSWMLLPVDRALALGTLQTLAELQGRVVDPLTEEEPGKILHEVRSGLDAGSALGGGGVYYGSIDATALFVGLVGELLRWGLPREDLDPLLPHVDRALEWLVSYGDRDGDGFVEYERATDKGLFNQGWKDSFDGITFASGQVAEPPIALAEVQGYAYAAYRTGAELAGATGDVAAQGHWTRRADTLKRRFNETFWLPDHGYFALALDRGKQPVDALSSNVGQCLMTGIIDEDKAPAVAAALCSAEMFTGFGIRTLASSMGAYNPMSYHNGSVWPHDNAIVAAGLMRYGFHREAQRVAVGLLDAAAAFGGRLPELFCGFDRGDFAEPVPYPTSCAPQAWAAASPVALLRTLLRLHPHLAAREVWCSPTVPAELLPLRVEGLHVGDSTLSIHVDGDGWELSGLPEGVRLVREPAGPSW